MGQLELKGIDLLPTFRCTSRCRHCSYRSSPELAGEMALADAERYVEEAASYSVEWIWLGGGDPFLCRRMLPSIARVARDTGIPDVYVVTNGHWAKNPTKAVRELSLLKRAGVTILSLSIDAFHQEHIPLECLKNALLAGKEVGFRRIDVSGQFLGSVDLDTEFNQVTERNLRLLEEEGYFEGVKVTREVLRLCGRAADSLTPYLPTKDEEELKDAKCNPRWLPIENLEKPKAVEIDWQGNITTCTGICIGNAKETSLSRILDEYDYKEHPITRILEGEGPYGLLKLAKRSGYTAASRGYVDGCHMCFDARRYLVKFYPSQLRPATCYVE